jgi:hypothetical protein
MLLGIVDVHHLPIRSFMNIHEARLIREIKKRCTYRRLAEIFYPEKDPGHGNQGYGEDLCRYAVLTLYPDRKIWSGKSRLLQNKRFIEMNKSYVGEFFWWE